MVAFSTGLSVFEIPEKTELESPLFSLFEKNTLSELRLESLEFFHLKTVQSSRGNKSERQKDSEDAFFPSTVNGEVILL